MEHSSERTLASIIGDKPIGVIGVGRCGSHLVRTLQPHSSHPIMQSDPGRAKREPDFPHIPLPELAEKAAIIFIATDLPEIRGVLLHIRAKLQERQIIIDTGSSKRDYVDLLRSIDASGSAQAGSIHAMAKPPPEIPSWRGQNGIVCTISERSRDAEDLGVALFTQQQMFIHKMRLEEHDRMMHQIQGKPHFLQAGACAAMGEGLPETGSIESLEKIGSPNFELFMLSVGRGATLPAPLQADLITSMASSPEGLGDLQRTIAQLQHILDLATHDIHHPAAERRLPAFIEAAREKLDPTRQWRKRMEAKTTTIVVRLANIRKRSLRLTAMHDRKGLLQDICSILASHGIDMNAIDSLPGKLPETVDFEIGRKDTIEVNLQRLQEDLTKIEVLLAKAEASY
ncbi:hypothetical protein A3J91_00115 [Candidatus Peribacteria bacterium RIFOXYC2_FULL_58_10]|nr:MAG: hypothetical protein A3J91_00115 [Candidatus Peribacteria bacterium RIFOXYC2_FULL_58_10]OGJ84127.1 MAG: hypothetical protein A2529_05070 [Candidatus Peribacteria bacterium RIFOXYD2_FULL_58_15]HAS33998.1 hypothetical protein [Candidatus Peribacteria bacterium]